MPLDAPTAALIGASVGALASTSAAVITASVVRANSYRQHLYEKRLEVYEEFGVASLEWNQDDYQALSLRDARIEARLFLCASWPVITSSVDTFAVLRELIAARQEAIKGDYDNRYLDNLRKDLRSKSSSAWELMCAEGQSPPRRRWLTGWVVDVAHNVQVREDTRRADDRMFKYRRTR